MHPRAVIGVDPGNHGAAVVVFGDRSTEVLRFFNRRVESFWRLNELSKQYDFLGLIEEVEGWLGDSTQNITAFGRNIGFAHALLELNGIPYTEIRPQLWKKEYRLLKRPKNYSKIVADKLFPGIKSIDDTADAYCLADLIWRRRFNQGDL